MASYNAAVAAHSVRLAGLLVAIGFSASASAEPRPNQVIWSNITYGMTKEEVATLLSKNRSVDLGNGCSAYVTPIFEAKRVIEVQLGGTNGAIECDSSILASLIAKYGQPRTTDVEIVDPIKGRNFAGGGLKRLVRLRQLGRSGSEPFDTVRIRTWFTGDTLVTLRLNETLREWSALYQPAEIVKPTLTNKI